MARKPVHLLTTSKKPAGRQGIWQAIRAQRQAFTVSSLAQATDIRRDTIRSYLHCLEAARYIDPLPDEPGTYLLLRDVGVEAPRVTKDGRPVTQGLAREQMWRTMKILTSAWSHRDLAIAASTEAVPVAEDDAKDYCRNLTLAGYLMIVVKGKGGSGPQVAATRYRFDRTKNTGPRPPMVQRMRTVFDPNLGRIVWHPEVDDE